MVWEDISPTRRASLIRIEANLNADQHISDTLPAVVLIYLRGIPNSSFQQNNAGPDIERRFRPFSKQKVFDCCPDLHGLQICILLEKKKKIWSRFTKRLAHHPTSANKVDEVW